jgi:hypothetical protein
MNMILAASVVALDLAMPALRTALDSSASWRMERRFQESARPLVSVGVVHCVAGEGIRWVVLDPFPSSVSMSTNSMVFADEDGETVKSLKDMPHYAELRKRTDAFALGDMSAFDGLFKIEADASDDGVGWLVRMTPEVKAMRRLFGSVELSGAETLTNAVMRTGDGGVSTIRFEPIPRSMEIK